MKILHIRGFTLVELMIIVSVLAVMVSLAVPIMRSTIQTNKFVANSTELASAFKYARSEAIKRRAQITVCGLKADKTCSGDANWAPNGFGALDGVTLLKAWVEPAKYDDIALTSSAVSFAYSSSGMLVGGTAIGVRVAFTDVDDNRCITISTTGRVNTEKIASTDSCP